MSRFPIISRAHELYSSLWPISFFPNILEALSLILQFDERTERNPVYYYLDLIEENRSKKNRWKLVELSSTVDDKLRLIIERCELYLFATGDIYRDECVWHECDAFLGVLSISSCEMGSGRL